MKHLKKIITILCIIFTICTIVPNIIPMEDNIVRAGTKKVVKITHKYKVKKNDNSKRKITIYGKAKDGSTVWKFSSPYLDFSFVKTNEYFINKNTVYLFSDKIYAISKPTGKVKWTYDYSDGAISAAFDSEGNIYFTAYYSNSLYCVTPQGKLKFEAGLPQEYYWPYKIKLYLGKIRVYVDGGFEDELGLERHYLTYDKKGKYIGLDK